MIQLFFKEVSSGVDGDVWTSFKYFSSSNMVNWLCLTFLKKKTKQNKTKKTKNLLCLSVKKHKEKSRCIALNC